MQIQSSHLPALGRIAEPQSAQFKVARNHYALGRYAQRRRSVTRFSDLIMEMKLCHSFSATSSQNFSRECTDMPAQGLGLLRTFADGWQILTEASILVWVTHRLEINGVLVVILANSLLVFGPHQFD